MKLQELDRLKRGEAKVIKDVIETRVAIRALPKKKFVIVREPANANSIVRRER